MALSCQKSLFDVPDELVYLNCAAQSPSLKASHAAGQKGLERKFHPWDPERGNLSAEMERCRVLFGGMVGGAGADDVAFCFSTSYGIAVAAANSKLQAGQNLVLLEGQFPSNYYSWIERAELDGAQVRVVARPTDFDWTSAVLAAIDADTGLVTLPNCHWTDGSLLDLVRIAARCREVGAPLIVDATQSIGARTFDNDRVGADFVVASGYKWLLSPDMMGFMYVAPHRQNGRLIEHNHASRTGGPSIEKTSTYPPNLRDGARRFDMGAADSMVHTPMALAALEQVSAWGMDAIAEYMEPLTDRIAELAAERGMITPPKQHRVAHYIGVNPMRPLPEGFRDNLVARNVHISLRGGVIRVAPYLFNTLDDIDRLFAEMDAVLAA
jgi:selenocysteine lyase/cysteine desulfurase